MIKIEVLKNYAMKMLSWIPRV